MDGESLDTQHLIEMVHDRVASGDPLALLEVAVGLAGLAGGAVDGMVDHFVASARRAGLSWTAIGDRLGVSKQAARQRFAGRLGEGVDAVDGGRLPVAPRLAACIEAAEQAADADGSVPGTQHLLLGLLNVGVAANVLDALGVTRDRVREANHRLFEMTGGGGDTRMIGDGEAALAMTRARRFAAERAHADVQTEHLLFVVTTDPGSSARRVLNDLGVEVASIKRELECVIGPAPRRRRRRSGGKSRAGTCSFCGCADPERPMVAGPGIWICRDCVALCAEILHGRPDQEVRGE